MIQTASQLSSSHHVWLYRTVFMHRGLRFLVTLLLVWLCLQPALMVYANESTPTNVETSVTETEQIAETNTSEPDKSVVLTDDEVTSSTPEPNTEPDPVATSAATHKTESNESTVASSTPDVPTEEVNDSVASSAGTSVSSSTTAASSIAGSSVDTDRATSSSATSIESVMTTDSTFDTELSSTTKTTPDTERQERSTTNANYYQFSRDDCTRVADGSFYCGEVSADRPDMERFFVALDADGDREIFAFLDNETVQITHNVRDDAAPYYDAVSNTLVWHARVGTHYQVMSYDFATEETTQLTDSSVNSMEPTRAGDNVVWQQWGTSNWDIMLYDGNAVTQLTDNAVPDIAPSVGDDVIVWKRVYTDEQVVVLYDLRTQTETEVSGEAADATVQNARMMLVYEGVTDSGERIIRGVDPDTGKLVPIAAVPAPLPERIPQSEPTDEVRALVQPKPNTEPEEVVASSKPNTAAGSSTPPTAATSSNETAANASSNVTNTPKVDIATSSETLIIPPATATTSPASTTVPVDVTTSTYDLVIPPQTGDSSQ